MRLTLPSYPTSSIPKRKKVVRGGIRLFSSSVISRMTRKKKGKKKKKRGGREEENGGEDDGRNSPEISFNGDGGGGE